MMPEGQKMVCVTDSNWDAYCEYQAYDHQAMDRSNDYMLEKFQSVPALRSQLESGYRYFFACTDAGERIGFLAFYPRGNELYLSKFYLQKDWRGRGLAWEMLRFVLESARALGLGAVELNVNRDNDAARAYERMGFVRVREEKNDIGAGFCMDDFVYRYDL